jgi:methionine-rich copper-binding protein CopC
MKKILLFISLIFAINVNAYGHAKLESSIPEAFESSGKPLNELKLNFNEPIKFLNQSSNLINSKNEKINFSYKVSDNVLLITPNKTLNNDQFKFYYNIISDDGHPISGILPFAVNEDIKSTSTENSRDYLDRYLELVIIFFIIFFIYKSLLKLDIKKNIFLFFMIIIIARFIKYYQVYATNIFQIGEVKSNIIYLLAGIILYIKIKYNLQLAIITLSLSGLFSGHHLLIESNLKYLFSLHLIGGLLWFASILAIKNQVTTNYDYQSIIIKYSKYATLAIILLIPSSIYLIYSTLITQLNNLSNWEYILILKTFLVFIALTFGIFNHYYIKRKIYNKIILKRLLNLEIFALFIVLFLSISLSLNVPNFSNKVNFFSVISKVSYNQGIIGDLEIKNTKDLSIISITLPDTVMENITSIDYHIMGNSGIIKHLSGNINIDTLRSEIPKLPDDIYNITIKISYNEFEEITGNIPNIKIKEEIK